MQTCTMPYFLEYKYKPHYIWNPKILHLFSLLIKSCSKVLGVERVEAVSSMCGWWGMRRVSAQEAAEDSGSSLSY